jgi:Leucine-rich repeat (LRR) protein
MRLNFFLIISLTFSEFLYSQSDVKVDATISKITVRLTSSLDSNTRLINSVLHNKDAASCKKLEVFDVKNFLPSNFFDIKWVKEIELYGTFNVNNGDVVQPNFSLGKEFNKFKNLSSLKVEYVGIKSIDKGFHPDSLSSLIIYQDALVEIPTTIQYCKNLTYLNLSRNKIKVINSEVCQLKKLEYLILELNEIDLIPSCIGAMNSLKSINLNANVIKSIPIELSKIAKLEYLDLAGNPITTIPDEIKKMKLKRLLIDLEGGWGD